MDREGGSRRVHRLGLAVISCLIVGLLCLAWLVLSEPAPETAAAVPVTAAATEVEASAATPAAETVEKAEAAPTAETEAGTEATPAAETEAGKGEQQAVPCEVHILLDSDLSLDVNHELKQSLRETFEIKEKIKSYGLLYLDTPDRAFGREGWINRIRMQDGKAKKGFELTVKKRYPVPGEDIAAALRLAGDEGFDLENGDWSPQVEWNAGGMTLSLSREIACPAGSHTGVADLELQEAAAMLEEGMPEEERTWKQGALSDSAAGRIQMAGPVFFRRFTGSYQDQKVKIEVWEIPGAASGEKSLLTELSLESEDVEHAALLREALTEQLKKLGVFVDQDGLKTQKVLDHYFGAELEAGHE